MELTVFQNIIIEIMWRAAAAATTWLGENAYAAILTSGVLCSIGNWLEGWVRAEVGTGWQWREGGRGGETMRGLSTS